MNRYQIYCTEEQTKKALELGAPLIYIEEGRDKYSNLHYLYVPQKWGYYIIPTAEQMIGWLRTKGFRFAFDDDTNYWNVCVGNKPITVGYGQTENKELAAIDAVLEYLSQNKK